MKTYISPACEIVDITSEGSLLTASPVIPIGGGEVSGTEIDSNKRFFNNDIDWDEE